MIELSNINKTYNLNKATEFKALSSISLYVKQGDFLAIMGKSGAGKSTLLHILGCIDRFEKGSYCFKGNQIKNLSDKKLSSFRSKEIGFVLQDFALLPDQTAAQNIKLPLFFNDTRLNEFNNKARNAIKAIQIEDFMDKPVKQLSGGQKQRVAIARAIVNSPSLILADEPTGSLDTTNSRIVMDILRQLNEMGHTIILVTHEREIAHYCKRVIQMSDGRIVEDLAL